MKSPACSAHGPATARLPFCYLAEFPLQEAVPGKDVEVEWMPFELRPYPNETLRPEGDYLQRVWQQSVSGRRPPWRTASV